MRILVGMPSPDSWGGPISSEPPFVEALRELGHEVDTEIYVYGDKAKPTPLLTRIRRVLQTAFRFRRALARRPYDVIFLNSSFDRKTVVRDAVSIFLMRARHERIFVKIHGSSADDLQGAGRVMRRLVDYLIERVDAWCYHTQEELRSFTALGFDASRFYPIRNATTVQLGLPEGFTRPQKTADEIFQLIFVSRFVPTKGLVETIEACELLRKRGVRFRLTCVGEGETRRDAEDAVGRLGLGRVVSFTGHISEERVTELLMRSDIFVFPTSHPEGFPNVLFKAVALGLPIVTTKIRAANDYLAEPENCLYSTTEPESIAEKLAALIADRTLRKAMSENNLAYGRTLTPHHVALEFDSLLQTFTANEPEA